MTTWYQNWRPTGLHRSSPRCVLPAQTRLTRRRHCRRQQQLYCNLHAVVSLMVRVLVGRVVHGWRERQKWWSDTSNVRHCGLCDVGVTWCEQVRLRDTCLVNSTRRSAAESVDLYTIKICILHLNAPKSITTYDFTSTLHDAITTRYKTTRCLISLPPTSSVNMSSI